MTNRQKSRFKSRTYAPSRRAQGNFSLSFLALTPLQKERNLEGIELARQVLKESQALASDLVRGNQ